MKKIANIVLILILAFISSKNVLAQSKMPYYVEEMQINTSSLKGSYPVFIGFKDKNFENNINNKINKIISTNTKSKSSKENIELSYEIIEDGYISSTVFYFKNIFTEEETVKSININTKNNSFVNINSIFGANGINYANKVVEDKSSKMDMDYKKVTLNSPFYVKNKNVYVIYGTGSITFLQKGNIIFEIPKRNLKNHTLKSKNCYKKSKYNVKMVPLREPLQYFDYDMKWSADNNSITISKNGQFISYLIVGQNRYSNAVNKFIRQLEFAPEIKNGITYVPISYFDQVLKMLFAVDNNNNIVISEYKL